MDEGEKEALKEKVKLYNAYYRNVCKSAYSSQIVKYLKTYLRNNDFTAGLDNGLYKLFFKNGFLDLKTSNFVEGIKRSDFITKTIPFDWEDPTAVDVDDVRKIIKKICNWNEQHLAYYMSMLGYCFTGDCTKEQNFWYLRGQTASNGKSIIFEILEILMPNYVMKANSDVLDKGAELKKEVATWRGLKVLWLNEVSTKPKDAERVKSICDGTGYKYNRMYATEAVVMPITFKLIAVSNTSYEGDGDKGIVRRFKILQHNAQFKEAYTEDNYEKLQFIADKDLDTKLTGDLKFALIALITTYSRAYWIDKKLKPYPDDWANEAKENMADNDKFGEWFNDTFETGVGYTLFKDDFTRIFSSSPVKFLKAKDEVARLSNGCRYESQMKETIKTISGRSVQKKGFWVGFRLKTAEPEEVKVVVVDGDGDEEEKETD
jgi:phage/plasmid-associated DNA primase